MNTSLSHLWRNDTQYRIALAQFVQESNRIEGIHRDPLWNEVYEADRFLHLEEVTVQELEEFVSIYQPGARLRRSPGMNVRVGRHIPPSGGYLIEGILRDLLDDIDAVRVDPWTAHCRYETLHPFTDCNGRSGRILWAWQMGPEAALDLGFLHAFYYQTLQNFPGRRRR